MSSLKPRMDAMISSSDSNEYFNSITHLIGTILAITGLTLLIVLSAKEHKWVHLVSFVIYGTTLFLSFLSSTLLHFFLLFNKYKRILGILDHNAIYLLIAGTYTPICLVVLGGMQGWILFALIWSMAIFFITIKSIFFKKLPTYFSNISYLSMGWLIMVIIYPLYLKLGIGAILLMLVGGACYTVGAIIFTWGKPNPKPPFFGNHEIWHLAVFFGNFTFYLLMLFYVLPCV